MIQRIVSLCLLGASSAALAGGFVLDSVRSMPPVEVTAEKAIAAERFVSSAGTAYRVDALPFDAQQLTSAKSAAVDAERAKPVQVGFPRGIAESAQTVPLGSLSWASTADGGKAAKVTVLATGAAGMRIGYRVSGPADGVAIRFAGSDRDEVYLAGATADSGLSWSPVLEGSQGTIEVHVKRGFDVSQFGLQLETLSHLTVAARDFGQKTKVLQIGDSDSCNIDVACVSNPSAALLNIAKATAKMVFNEGASTYLCTGTLINSSSGANYFYTAAHCISSQAAASTLNTYWFFDAVACDSLATPPYQLLTGGADLMMTEPTMDGTLLRLRLAPPAGTVRAGWNASVIPTGTTVVGIHHPSGDLKKFSQGSMQGYAQGPQAYGSTPRFQANKDSFITVRWVNGTTEGGSSGSGVFTYNASGSYYELRGGLEGGAASCSNLSGIDRFSRMDLLFTRLSPYLAPAAIIPTTTSAQASMVEYFNPQFNFYFISSRESEKTVLDSITDSLSNPLWYRTGYWFKTDPASSSQTSSITRYFIPGAAKNGTRGTHFYTALNSDRALITSTGKERFSSGCAGVPNTYFCNEGIDSYVAAPIGTGSSASCLSSEQPIYRAFRGATDDGNHRYLVNSSMYSYMVSDQGWAGEGVAFCAKP